MSSSRLWLRPGLLGLHAVAVVAVGVCVVMGLWQLGVYDSRQEQKRVEQRTTAPALLIEVWGPDEPFKESLDGQPVTVNGRFAPASQQVWVTDRELDGRRGVWLVAPVLVEGTDASLLVVRGWAPRAAEPPSVPGGQQSFDAVLLPSEGGGVPFDDRTRTLGTLSIPALTNVIAGDLYSGYAISTSTTVVGGLTPVQPPDPEVSWTVGLRNLAYALQWWVFGAFALFMWWRMASEDVAMRRAQADAESVSDASIG